MSSAHNHFDHVWFWKTRPLLFTGGQFHRVDRKGQACRVVARGAMNSVLVEFADGHRVLTSRYAVRAAQPLGHMELFKPARTR